MTLPSFTSPGPGSWELEDDHMVRPVSRFSESIGWLEAFADGHVGGYSVTAEVFANMADAIPLTYAAWDNILTLGQGSVDQLEGVCAQIEAAQPVR